MREIWEIAFSRFKVISSIVSDTSARIVAILFYFTFFVPFGIVSVLFSDPLRIKENQPKWIDRDPVPSDLDSAKQQG